MGSVGLGLALTGIGVVGPFTMTCPGKRGARVRAGWAKPESRAEVRVAAWGWGYSSRTPGLSAGPCPLQSQGLLGQGSGDLVTATSRKKQPLRSGAGGQGGGEAKEEVRGQAERTGQKQASRVGKRRETRANQVVQQLLGPVLVRAAAGTAPGSRRMNCVSTVPARNCWLLSTSAGRDVGLQDRGR